MNTLSSSSVICSFPALGKKLKFLVIVIRITAVAVAIDAAAAAAAAAAFVVVVVAVAITDITTSVVIAFWVTSFCFLRF